MKETWRMPLSEGRAGARRDTALSMVPRIAAAMYRLLVWAYPPSFRRQFAFEMACDFDEATCEAWRDGRWLAVLPLWMRLGHDFTWTMVVQWLRYGLPVVPVLSALGTTMFVLAAVSALWRPLQARAVVPMDNDLMLLLFLATTVILIAAAVITFTVCFCLLVRRRTARARRV